MKLRVLVVDDEPLARLRLRDLIGEVSWLDCVGEAADAASAARGIAEKDPDLVFLDVQLPGTLGTSLAARLGPRPAVVFTTAYDRYAVEAFELHALDYLLKPFGRARFRLAMERARDALGRGPRTPARLRAAILERFFVRDRGRMLFVPASAVERLEAQDDYVALHCEGRQHLVRIPLGHLERRLDPERFARVHRRHIVNLEFVRAFAPRPDRRVDVHLASGDVVTGSRSRSRTLRRLVRRQAR